MATAIVSDLHLGALVGADVARAPAAQERLLEALAGADRIVLLGDTLELRERPLAEALEVVRPLFEALARTAAGRRIAIVAGNHDHGLADPWLARLRLDGAPLGPENEWPVGPDDGPAARIAGWMPDVEVTLAYPGLWLRPDVYATHGHYLDLHLTIPRPEAIAATAMGRITGRGSDCSSAAEYEAVLAPMYAFYAGLAQGASPAALARGGRLSRVVWGRANGDGRLARMLVGGIAIPGGVAVLNRLGLGPFNPVLSGEELRRSGLLAMSRVAEALAPGAEHVVFGHTHRPGPLPDDAPAEWTTLSGSRLWNCGSWYHEPPLVARAGENSPYWPGSVMWLDDEGPPRLTNVLRGFGGLLGAGRGLAG